MHQFLSIILLNLYLSISIAASEYTPQDYYGIKSHVLDNGLEVYLNERHHARATSIRLVVGFGQGDSPCGVTEIAHFVEHLLFTGTSKHTEEELDAVIEDNGGIWNATTGEEKTTYEIDIYSPFTELALDALFEIFTKTSFTQEKIDLVRGIVNQELGGAPSNYRKWLFEHDIGKSGLAKSNEIIFNDDEYCRHLESIYNITLESVVDAFERYYVSNNMALIVVGDFDSTSLLKTISETFGQLKSNTIEKKKKSQQHSYEIQDDFITGTLSPILDSNLETHIRFRVPGYTHPDYAAWYFICNYLDRAFYNELRINQGLVYSTGCEVSLYRHSGVINFYAGSSIDAMHNIYTTMLTLADEFIESPLQQDEFNNEKRRMLLQYAGAYQSNEELAEYYAALHHIMLWPGLIYSMEDLIKPLSPEDIQTMAMEYLNVNNAIIVHEAPTITYEDLFMILAIIAASLLIIIGVWASKKVTK